jgi:hypothetical protein
MTSKWSIGIATFFAGAIGAAALSGHDGPKTEDAVALNERQVVLVVRESETQQTVAERKKSERIAKATLFKLQSVVRSGFKDMNDDQVINPWTMQPQSPDEPMIPPYDVERAKRTAAQVQGAVKDAGSKSEPIDPDTFLKASPDNY